MLNINCSTWNKTVLNLWPMVITFPSEGEHPLPFHVPLWDLFKAKNVTLPRGATKGGHTMRSVVAHWYKNQIIHQFFEKLASVFFTFFQELTRCRPVFCTGSSDRSRRPQVPLGSRTVHATGFPSFFSKAKMFVKCHWFFAVFLLHLAQNDFSSTQNISWTVFFYSSLCCN